MDLYKPIPDDFSTYSAIGARSFIIVVRAVPILSTLAGAIIAKGQVLTYSAAITLYKWSGLQLVLPGICFASVSANDYCKALEVEGAYQPFKAYVATYEAPSHTTITPHSPGVCSFCQRYVKSDPDKAVPSEKVVSCELGPQRMRNIMGLWKDPDALLEDQLRSLDVRPEFHVLASYFSVIDTPAAAGEESIRAPFLVCDEVVLRAAKVWTLVVAIPSKPPVSSMVTELPKYGEISTFKMKIAQPESGNDFVHKLELDSSNSMVLPQLDGDSKKNYQAIASAHFERRAFLSGNRITATPDSVLLTSFRPSHFMSVKMDGQKVTSETITPCSAEDEKRTDKRFWRCHFAGDEIVCPGPRSMSAALFNIHTKVSHIYAKS